MSETTITRATFTPKNRAGAAVDVHFNPASLEYTITNRLEEKTSGNRKKQYVTSSTAKLSMELVFDTTYNGEDVRLHTGKVAQFMQPMSEGQRQVPAVVEFRWGLYKFQGIVEQYKETIDFFAPTGVPLRARISLTLTSQDVVFAADSSAAAPPDEAIEVPTAQDTTSLGAQVGDTNAGRGIAAANNQASMRFPSGPLTVGGGVSLRGPVAFASGGVNVGAGVGLGASAGIGVSGGAGLGISGGAGLSARAGAGIRVGGGVGVSASAGAGIGVRGAAGFSTTFGGTASAGVSATAGAFAGLRVQKETRLPQRLDTTRLLPPAAASFTSSGSAKFSVGGQVSAQAAAGLSADVGANASLRGRIQFEQR
ncbi:MAG TPA: hypothetical protein VIH59_03630 [Candidatus Tectomicrobia bacterium]